MCSVADALIGDVRVRVKRAAAIYACLHTGSEGPDDGQDNSSQKSGDCSPKHKGKAFGLVHQLFGGHS